MATGFFNCNRDMITGESDGPAFFDCRVFQVPNKDEAVNALMWREFDATRNSISMLARHHFNHKYLHGKNTSQMQDMLMVEKQVNWNDLPIAHKRGTYVQHQTFHETLSVEEAAQIQARTSGKFQPPSEVTRSRVVTLDIPVLTRVTNRIDMVFSAAAPIEQSVMSA